MKAVMIVLTIVAVFSGGCSLTATMIPVEGPLAELRPVPVIQAKADGVMGNTGNLRFTMPGNDACAGRWSSTAGDDVSIAAGSLITQYGSTHLTGYAVGPSGRNPGLALVTCQSGRTFQLEFLSNGGHGFGIGKDNEGNIYRFVFCLIGQPRPTLYLPLP